MAKLSNTPRQALNFDLERRKSYAFQVQVKTENGSAIDLTGCTLRFVMKEGSFDDDPFDLLNVIVNSEALIGDPTAGIASFAFQAAELDVSAGEYDYTITLWTPDGYSTLLCKGLVNILENSESHSMHRMYSLASAASALELVMRSGDVVQINVAGVPVLLPQSHTYAASATDGTYPIDTTVKAIGMGSVSVIAPASGRVLGSYSCYVDASAATGAVYGSLGAAGAQKLAPAGYVGRVRCEAILTGTPGQVLNIVPRMWLMTGGTASVQVGGSAGVATVSASPLTS